MSSLGLRGDHEHGRDLGSGTRAFVAYGLAGFALTAAAFGLMTWMSGAGDGLDLRGLASGLCLGATGVAALVDRHARHKEWADPRGPKRRRLVLAPACSAAAALAAGSAVIGVAVDHEGLAATLNAAAIGLALSLFTLVPFGFAAFALAGYAVHRRH